MARSWAPFQRSLGAGPASRLARTTKAHPAAARAPHAERGYNRIRATSRAIGGPRRGGSVPGEAERERTWLERLRDLAHRLANDPDPEELFPRILDAAIELTRAERGFLLLLDGVDGQKRRVEEARGFDRASLSGPEARVSRRVVRRTLEEERGVSTTNLEDADLLGVTSLRDEGVRSVACVPLRARGRVLGALYLDDRIERTPGFSPRDLEILGLFADQAAIALEAAGKVPPTPLPPPSGRLLGQSPAMRQLRQAIARAARSRAPVLILGETGSGKELVARELHALGSPTEPFLAENCAAIAEELLESELFGHGAGAFTGAEGPRDGLFLRAGRGTLFLDEIGDTSPRLQAKLLRVLQEGEVRPVGEAETRSVHCRVVAATHRDLAQAMASGEFRADLYYRLDVLRLCVPPLRARREDLSLLLDTFAGRHGLGDVSPDAFELLYAYDWPGNVRQLENEVRRLAALGVDPVLPQHLSPSIRGGPSDRAYGYAGKTLAQIQREAVLDTLRACGGNKSAAARKLGIPRGTFYRLLERHGIDE
ncbi:MAG: sigma-54-dependent Fis family transcriptional regulator [Planctomycetota bacterium]|nr:MAG: sigma-54-dependent Fis family transcriptional regulator [Planctomycetota bacterium]